MRLSEQERAWLAGESGTALRRAMEIIVALGRIYGADRLLPVKSVQISGVSYRNLGEAGLDFLRKWRDEGAHVRVPTMLNPAAMDLRDWSAQGFEPQFASRQQAVIAAFRQMGVGEGTPIPTCTPYLIGSVPQPGEHVAWAESSAVSYANSVLGARTNREGGPGAIAAALTGKTANYGLHRDESRLATLRVRVKVPLRVPADYSALGAIVGEQSGNRVPYFEGLPLTRGEPLWEAKLKALGAALAATGAVALYHVADVTPEARTGSVLAAGCELVEVDDLSPGYARFESGHAQVDLVWVGCPHAASDEITRVAEALRGRTLRVPLWITCARPVKAWAASQGLIAIIEASGGRVFADACMAIAPLRTLGYRAVATTSAKGAFYLQNLAGVATHFGTLSRCVDAALTGHWV